MIVVDDERRSVSKNNKCIQTGKHVKSSGFAARGVGKTEENCGTTQYSVVKKSDIL